MPMEERAASSIWVDCDFGERGLSTEIVRASCGERRKAIALRLIDGVAICGQQNDWSLTMAFRLGRSIISVRLSDSQLISVRRLNLPSLPFLSPRERTSYSRSS